MKKHILCSLLAASVLASCTQDDLVEQGSPLPAPVPLVLNATGLDVVATPVTRGEVDDNTWDEGTEVALCEGESKPVMTYKIEDGKLKPKDDDNTIWWNYNTEEKTLTAWHPRTTTKGDVVSMPKVGGDWTAPKDQANGIKADDDLLYANSTVSFTDRENASLKFSHMLAKVVININNSDYIKAAKNVEVTMGNMSIKGKFSSSGSGLKLVGEYGSETIQPYQLPQPADGKFATYEALVMPQAVTGYNIIIVKVDNTEYTWPIEMKKPRPNNSFASGTQYTFNIEVEAKELKVSAEPSIEWTTDGGATGAGSVTLP